MTDYLDISLRIGLAKELKGNRVAILLHRNVGNRRIFNESRLNIVQDFIGGYSKESSDYKTDTSTELTIPFRDLRFRHLTLCNIKRFPGEINEKSFGISFEKGNNPVHSVFLGSNGVGKTSLYAAIEYAGMRKMNTAIVRGYDRFIGHATDKTGQAEVDQSEYLLRPKINVNESSIGLYCNYGSFLLEGKQIIKPADEKLVCEAFFCSAYDVEWLERCQDFTSFFISQTGLSDYYYCLQTLYYLYRYVTEFDNADSNSVDGLDLERMEAIARLRFGISLGAIHVNPDGFAYTVYLDDIYSFDNSTKPASELISLLEEACLKLRDEVESLPNTSWFIFPIKNEYGNIIKTLYAIKGNLQKGKTDTFREKRQLIKEFNSFRAELQKSIAGIHTAIENSESSENKRILNESIMSELLNIRKQKDIVAAETFKNNSLGSHNRAHFINDLTSLIEYLEARLKVLVQAKEKKINDTVENLLSDSFALDNDKIGINISFNSFKNRNPISKEQTKKQFEEEFILNDVHRFINFDVKILSSRGDLKSETRIEVNPRSYLNTFRYKLFCVALKLALLCISKEAYNLNFPFVIDDVFDSSDFDSRLRLNDFMKDMFEMHNALLPDDKYALQLIFFTQDDLIANQVYKGLIGKTEKNKVKFSQIFDYHECDDKDKCQIVLSDKSSDNTADSDVQHTTIEYVSVEDIIE